MEAIHHREPARLSERDLGISPAVDDVLARALAKEIGGRFDTAMSMARALEAALPPASDREIADWVEAVAGDILIERAEQVALFEGDDTGSSKARLFAAQTPPSGTTARRDALVPPPLDSATDEHTTLRGSSASMPTLQIEAAAALAAAPPPAATAAQVESESEAENATTANAGVARAAGPELRAMNTPLVMVGPAAADSDAPESGVTRIEPVERRSRFRTPIPMPFTIPPPYRRESRGRSFFQLAALVVAPPLIVFLGVLGMRAAADARVGHRAAAMEVAAPAAPPPEPAPVPLPIATVGATAAPPPVAVAVLPPAPAPPVEPVVDARAKSGARPRPPRPGHHPPRAVRPAPVAVSR